MKDSSGKDGTKTSDDNSAQRDPDPTIVGGRPLARNRSLQGIPRGIEVLIKKASVDPEFRTVLLEKRAEAAVEIELELSATEAAMLNAIPAAQVEKIIDGTNVPNEHRRVFLGKVAGAMLAVLGLALSACRPTYGITPDLPRLPMPAGSTIDEPRSKPVAAKAASGREVLRMTPTEKGKNAVDVVVSYECPFEKGVMSLSCRKDPLTDAPDMDYRPWRALISKGKGEITFHVSGKTGTTQWIQARLFNDTKQCWDARDWQPSDAKEYQPGEYAIEGCLILHIIEYRKTWKA